MPAETLEDLFLIELKDVYDTEHRLLDALDELSQQTTQEEAQQAFEEHREETERHIQHLEQAFETLGEEPEREECEGIQGMIEETEEFFEEKAPAEQVANRYAIGAAQKTERYEITAYENMLQWAQEADMDREIIEAIEANLADEQSALQDLQRMAEEFDYQQIVAA
ncbi:ferritin-like domain-containing protein [Halobacteria archaeon HArc-gm2]|nr:ferritin-like domain-containing protein [Halobacteria archaeon HArc-gm2]